MPLEAWLKLWTGPAAGPAGGLGGAAESFQRFAADYARLGTLAGTGHSDWEAAARRLTAELLPAWPAGVGPATAEGAAAALASMTAATAAGFVRRLQAQPQPRTLRATFDAWVDAAEEAFRSVAFTASFTATQAAFCNELVRLRAAQQGFVDEAARLTGLPSRGEVDALHDTVRELRRELAERASPAPPRRPRRRKPA